MIAVHGLVATLILTSFYVESQSPVFLVDPVSVAAVDGTTVEFTCTAKDVEEISYRVNGSSASGQDVQDKGFVQLGEEPLEGTVRRRNLTVTVSSLYNNTEIFCRGIGTNNNVNSETATLTVQGPLISVGNLSSFIISSTVHISWSPPFTLPGTAITGYNISVTSNGTTTNNFTSDSYVLRLSNITNSPCNEIKITVSGYNGLNGETDSISVHSSNPVVPLTVDVLKDLQLTVRMNVTSICIDERPTTVDVTLFRDDTVVYRTDVTFSDDPSTEILTFNVSYTVEEDRNYTITVSFSIFDGDFVVISGHMFNTLGVGSANLNDTTEDSVSCRCIFHPFSTDTGCTIQLLLLGIVRYTGTFSRSGSTATGSIFGVATGLYLVYVFDQGNPTVVLTSELMVIGEPVKTTPATSVTSNTSTSTSTVPGISSTTTTTATFMPPVTPSVNPIAVRDSQTTTFIAIAITIGAVIIILLAVVLTLIVCIMWWKKYHNDSKGNKLESSDAFLASSDFDGTPPTTSSPLLVETQDIAEPVLYADLSEIKKRHRHSLSKPADSRVVYSDLLIKGQPPPPPYEPVELKRVSNIQASVTVIPVGTNVDESEFNNEIVELRFPHMDNYQEAIESRAINDYPPPPEGRAPSPPNEDDDQTPPIPDRHLPDVVQNNQRPADKEEIIVGIMNTPTATYL